MITDLCPSGHKFTSENTIINSAGYRVCRECHNRWNREWLRNRRAELKGTRTRIAAARELATS